MSETLVRLAVGIEDADDVIADLSQALDYTFGSTTPRTASLSEPRPVAVSEPLPG